jgi:hypothetical protein
MNATDLARLEVAKRAYKATEPSDAEVQTGVRRARLSLSRPKPRRAWFSKGLVLVVLAIGSLAYARPQALGEIVEKLLPRDDAASSKRALAGAAVVAPVEVAKSGNGKPAQSAAVSAVPAEDSAPQNTLELGTPASKRTAPKKPTTTSRAALSSQASAPQAVVTMTAQPAEAQNNPPGAVTNWGRVGQALARGDNTEALSALNELSASDDQRTRDKADLGRAQLLMAHGDPDQACALARSLTHRRAGGRIERQAQLLLKSCTR